MLFSSWYVILPNDAVWVTEAVYSVVTYRLLIS